MVTREEMIHDSFTELDRSLQRSAQAQLQKGEVLGDSREGD